LLLASGATWAQDDGIKPEPTARPTLYDLYPPTVMREPGAPDSGPNYDDPVAAEDGFGRTRISEVPGESIDPRTGALTLSAVDIVMPGNGGMDIVVSRTRRDSFFADPGPDYFENRSFQSTIADWNLDIPFIQLRSVDAYKQDAGGVMPQSPIFYSDNPDTCGAPFSASPYQQSGFNPSQNNRLQFFAGVRLQGMPGGGGAELLFRSGTTNEIEATRFAQLQTEYGTADHLIASCGETRYNSIRPGARSAFSVRSPDGKSYYFDEPSAGNNLAVAQSVNPPPTWGHMRVFLTNVYDRNGNWLTYEYDGQPEIQSVYPNVNGVQRMDRRDYPYLTRIYSSDGRQVTFTWECNPYGKGRSLGLRNCGTNVNTYEGAPLFRLKTASANGRTWTYVYDDSEALGPNQSRLLKSVQLPNGQSWQYAAETVATAVPAEACGRYPYTFPQSVNYTVTHPEGATVQYKTAPRRIVRVNSCRYVTKVAERVVTPLSGSTQTTKWCFSETVQGNYSPLWTHVLGPTRAESLLYAREQDSNNSDKWKEGLLLERRVYEPIASCPAGAPAGNYLQRESFEYVRGKKLTDPPNSLYPGYAEAINAPRPTTKVTTERPDTGTFEQTYDTFDTYSYPALARASLAGASSTATTARRTLSVTSNRAVVFTGSPSSSQIYVTWKAPGVSNVDLRYSENGGAEIVAASNQGNNSNKTITRKAGRTYTVRLYPAGQSAASARIAEFVVLPTDTQYKFVLQWLLGLQERSCVVGSDTGSCSTVGTVSQSVDREYDLRGNLTRQTQFGVSQSYSYTSDGDTASITDARGKTTTYQNYLRGTPQRIVLPGTDGAVKTLVVNPTGSIERITDAEDNTTRFEYDTRERLQNVYFPIGSAMTIDRSPDGRTRTSTLGTSVKVSRFDGFGRLLSEENKDTLDSSNNFKTVIRYDAAGRVEFQSDPHLPATSNPAGVTFAYDALDRPKTQTRSSNGASMSTFYTSPETVTQRDANNRSTVSVFRSFGSPGNEQLMQTRSGVTLGTDTWQTEVGMQFDRDVLGFARSLTSGKSNTTAPNADVVQHRYQLDGRRLLVDEFMPELGAAGGNGYNVSYCRDNAGNITGKSLRALCVAPSSANWMSQVFDERGRLTLVDYADASSPDVTIEYNKNDQPRRSVKGSVAIDIIRNEMGAPRFVTHSVDGKSFRMEYRYNSMNHLSSIVYPSGKEYSLSPDAFGRPTRISGIINDVDYYPNGAVKRVVYANGVEQNWTQTNELQIDTIAASKGTTSILNFDYAYDLVGNTTAVDDLVRSDSVAMGYDELDRLKWTQYVSGGVIPRHYDAIGNVVRDESFTFSYDRSSAGVTGTNRLIGSTGIPGRGAISYDAYGSMTSDGARNLQFGGDGNLLRATLPVTREFIYDSSDRVVTQIEANGNKRYRVYAGENVVMEYDPQSFRVIEHLYLGSLLMGSRVLDSSTAQF